MAEHMVGECIPLEARIIACCDTWNAMRTDRPYRNALAVDVAIAPAPAPAPRPAPKLVPGAAES